jgi:hypothetical protein
LGAVAVNFAVKTGRSTVSSFSRFDTIRGQRDALRSASTEQMRTRSFPLNLITANEHSEAA